MGEKILIGTDIVITITDIDPRGGRVRVGVQCPREVPVNRSENITPEEVAAIEKAAKGGAAP